MSNYILTPAARADIKDILKYSKSKHGEQVARHYDALIKSAIKQVSKTPYKASTRIKDEIAEGLRSYHLKLAKVTADSMIKNPRHVIFYFTVDEQNKIIVTRVLHDARLHTKNMIEARDQAMAAAQKARELYQIEEKEHDHMRDIGKTR